ncbi:MAG: hypothetical protein KJI70_00485 [Patescibacteria group bacterium]|nr:hypothetical protein [Patescibacteria group bacterium]
MKPEVLRKKYPKFIYIDYSYKISKKNLEIFFNFKIEPDIFFKPKIIIENIDQSRIEKIGEGILNNLIFNLGLVELISYWKATCSKVIEIKCGELDSFQIKWLKNLIKNGMGQFFYENKMNWQIADSLKIISSNKKDFNVFNKKLSNNILLPIGGGKDSIVSLEILKKSKHLLTCFSLNPNNNVKKIFEIGGCKKTIIVKRRIDSKLLELNRKKYLNGHTPFSAYLAFLTALIGVIYDYKYIAFSNERSSNEGNVEHLGKIINHQYSKTFNFEEKFRKYSKKYLAKDIEYFSFLRPFYEIQIGKLFSKYFNKYGNVFLSCNEAHKTYSGKREPIKKWCGKCSKCLFVFLILYPFIETKKLIQAFGKNLFEKKELLGLMKELIGERKFKPFECVGTTKESLIALYLSLKKVNKNNKKLPYLLKHFEDEVLSEHSDLGKEAKHMLEAWNKNHNLQNKFLKVFDDFLFR